MAIKIVKKYYPVTLLSAFILFCSFPFGTLGGKGYAEESIRVEHKKASSQDLQKRRVSAKSLTSLKKYMVKLINKDRNKNGLGSVEFDATASKAGQKHTNEMAKYGYLSHWDKAGEKPDQRYTEAGGKDYVAENAFLYSQTGSSDIKVSKKFMRYAEKVWMNSPEHRANILGTNHTHVGIGISVNKKKGYVAMTQEFVDRYGTYEDIPEEANINDNITIKGTLDDGIEFYFIGIYWEKLPQKMKKSELKATGSYSSPDSLDYKTLYSSTVSVNGQSFELTAPVGDYGEGLYYVRIYVKKEGINSLSSQRTVVVK